jgi:hypothetical protein
MTPGKNIDPEIQPGAVELAQTTPMSIIAAAVKSGASIDVVRGLFELQKEFEANEARKAFYVALNKFKEICITILKTENVSFDKTSYKHAKLPDILAKLQPRLSEFGLNVLWKTENLESTIVVKEKNGSKTERVVERVRVECFLSHFLGHSISTSLTGNADISGGKNDIQGVGSSVSYLERYTLKAILGIAESDDDNDGRGVQNGCLTPSQVSEIFKQSAEIPGKSRESIMRGIADFFRVENIADIPETMFPKILEMILSKKQTVEKSGK